MPTYQYRCNDCSADLEVFQRMTDPSLTVCPRCEGHLRKVFSAVGVVFKGSGFYATDNRTKSKATSSSDTAAKDGPAKDTADSTPKPAPAAKTDSASSTSSTKAPSALAA
jgi:putative FmdB family regulatory protein